MKAIIIEDEERAAALLRDMMTVVAPKLDVAELCADLPAGVKAIRRHNPDIVFLDIELPVYSGIQLLDFFNPGEIHFHIIFTTAYNEYAVRAFEMSAVGYLLKPIDEEKLRIAIAKAEGQPKKETVTLLPLLKQNLLPEGIKKIVVPVSTGFEVLALANICYLKAEGSYTQISFADNTNLLVSKNLKHFEQTLSGINGFLRIHRSYIANLNFVRRLVRKDGGFLCLENKAELPIADDRLETVINAVQRI